MSPPQLAQRTSGTLNSAADTGRTTFYNFLQSVQWAPEKRVQMCTGSLACRFGLAKTDVDLRAASNSYVVDPRAVDPAGVVILRAVNKGKGTTLHYRLEHGPYVYAFVVYPDVPGGSTSHWVLEQVDTVSHITILVSGVGGPYHGCFDRPAATTDDVGLYRCGEAHKAVAINKSDLGLFSMATDQVFAAFASQFAEEAPLWKSCPAGCCTLPY